jgi:Animal haem peroxidase
LRKGHSRTAALPGPREVSNALFADKDRQDKDATLAVMQWAQFVGLDLSHTPSAKMGKYEFLCM